MEEHTEKLKTVRDVNDLNLIADSYTEAFKRRYGAEPLIDDSGREILRGLHRAIGKERTIEMINHYLTIGDEWFIKMGHNLETLKRSAQAILASLGLKKRASGGTTGVRIMDEVEHFIFYLFEDKNVYQRLGLTKEGKDLYFEAGKVGMDRALVKRILDPYRDSAMGMSEIEGQFKDWLKSFLVDKPQ